MVLRLLQSMKKLLLLSLASAFFATSQAQKVDSIFFHLYTDSLKKGQHNYINIDGKKSDGTWTPMTSKDIEFSCAEASFSGNELIIPENFNPAKVKVKAVLKSNPAIWIERTIWIKTKPDGPLPGKDEIMQSVPKRKSKNKD